MTYEEIPDEDIDIDVCMSCGRYYGYNQSLKDLWIKTYKPRNGDVMPQLCFNCMAVK